MLKHGNMEDDNTESTKNKSNRLNVSGRLNGEKQSPVSVSAASVAAAASTSAKAPSLSTKQQLPGVQTPSSTPKQSVPNRSGKNRFQGFKQQIIDARKSEHNAVKSNSSVTAAAAAAASAGHSNAISNSNASYATVHPNLSTSSLAALASISSTTNISSRIPVNHSTPQLSSLNSGLSKRQPNVTSSGAGATAAASAAAAFKRGAPSKSMPDQLSASFAIDTDGAKRGLTQREKTPVQVSDSEKQSAKSIRERQTEKDKLEMMRSSTMPAAPSQSHINALSAAKRSQTIASNTISLVESHGTMSDGLRTQALAAALLAPGNAEGTVDRLKSKIMERGDRKSARIVERSLSPPMKTFRQYSLSTKTDSPPANTDISKEASSAKDSAKTETQSIRDLPLDPLPINNLAVESSSKSDQKSQLSPITKVVSPKPQKPIANSALLTNQDRLPYPFTSRSASSKRQAEDQHMGSGGSKPIEIPRSVVQRPISAISLSSQSSQMNNGGEHSDGYLRRNSLSDNILLRSQWNNFDEKVGGSASSIRSTLAEQRPARSRERNEILERTADFRNSKGSPSSIRTSSPSTIVSIPRSSFEEKRYPDESYTSLQGRSQTLGQPVKSKFGLTMGKKRIASPTLPSPSNSSSNSSLSSHLLHPKGILNMFSNRNKSPEPVVNPSSMKTTMRKEQKASFNEDKPWKHHEDAWKLTDAEKKRYEGIWAANKGSHLPFILPSDDADEENDDDNELAEADDAADNSEDVMAAENKISSTSLDHINSEDVHGYVVRDIWKRSRLSDETLAHIWDLVDRNKDGTLDREGFLVGMWLVDQCLYGRKLPVKVDPKVWSSVGRLNLKVKIKKKKDKSHSSKQHSKHNRGRSHNDIKYRDVDSFGDPQTISSSSH